jgi:hypothetical protein
LKTHKELISTKLYQEKLKLEFKSDLAQPQNPEENLLTIVRTNFQEIVMDKTKDV